MYAFVVACTCAVFVSLSATSNIISDQICGASITVYAEIIKPTALQFASSWPPGWQRLRRRQRFGRARAQHPSNHSARNRGTTAERHAGRVFHLHVNQKYSSGAIRGHDHTNIAARSATTTERWWWWQRRQFQPRPWCARLDCTNSGDWVTPCSCMCECLLGK